MATKRIGLVELIPDARPVESRYVVRCGRLAVELGEGELQRGLAKLYNPT